MGEEHPFAALVNHRGLPEQYHTHMAPEWRCKLATIATQKPTWLPRASQLQSTWVFKNTGKHIRTRSQPMKKVPCGCRWAKRTLLLPSSSTGAYLSNATPTWPLNRTLSSPRLRAQKPTWLPRASPPTRSTAHGPNTGKHINMPHPKLLRNCNVCTDRPGVPPRGPFQALGSPRTIPLPHGP